MFKKNLNKILFLFLIAGLLLGSDFLFANYVLKNDDISVFLVGLHKGISNNNFDNNNTNIQQEGILSLLRDIKNHASISVISMLEFSAVKEVVLEKYLDDTDKLLINVGFATNVLKQDISLLGVDMNNCLNEKDLYDRQFFESIALYDEIYMNESLQKSIEAQKCAGENRIKMNAKKALLDQLNYYYDFVKIKYEYIQSQRDLIIRNFDFMKNGLLDELVTTKEVLNTLGN
ncbi:MAG: hypothetical protein WAZ12_03210 [Candidatus Absconditicoccaceae bacterium]